MHFDVITIGSATIDVYVKTKSNTKRLAGKDMFVYPFGAKIAIKDLQFHVGGGGTNTAAAFSRLGLKTGYIGSIGDDENGKTILREIKKWGISFLGQRQKGASGYSVILDSVGHDRTILTHKGANNMLYWEKRFMHLDTHLLFCSTMMEQSFQTLLKILRYNTHIPVVVNMSSYLAKKGIQELTSLLEHTHTLIFNKEEAYLLIGEKRPFEKIASRLHKIGIKQVIITDGKNGVYASDGKTSYNIQAKKINVLETTGAGDAFGAAFASGMFWKKDFLSCIEMGMNNAESVISAYGTKNKLLDKKEIEKSLKKKHTMKKKRIIS